MENHNVSRFKAVFDKVEAFFLTPASPRPLGALRIGLAGILLVQGFLIRNDLLSFFAHDGLVQGPLAQYLSEPNTPKLSWFVDFFAQYGISEASCIFWITRFYFFNLILLLVGIFTRTTSVIVFLLQWMLVNSGYCSAYGFDTYAHIFLFYVMCFPVGDAYSLDVAFGRRSGLPSTVARLGLRTMQLHIALAYLSSGIEKMTGIQWWNGELIWRALSMPEYRQYDMSWLSQVPFIAMAAGWGTLIVETLFCVCVWPKRTRMLWVFMTASMHLGISIFMGLQIFGVIMCILVISLFAFSADPQPMVQKLPQSQIDPSPLTTAFH